MEIIKEVIKQDIAAAIQAFEKDDFRFVNIIGNRTMSNLLIGEQNDSMIFGYLLKEVFKEFEEIRRKGGKRLAECKGIGRRFLNDLHTMIKDEIGVEEVWEKYYEYENSIRKYIPADFELEAYQENVEFTRMATSMLARHLKENKELLLKEKNRLLDGILNELSRIINVHGLDRHTLVFYLLLVALNDYYKYLLYAESKEGIIENEEEFKEKIFPYIDKIINLQPDLNPEKLYKQSNEILGDLASQWRRYFINYMERVEREIIVERRPPIEIPEEAKEKISKTIREAIEKEAKK